MKKPEIPANETQRLASLAELQLLDSAPDPAFDHLAELAQSVFHTPMVLVSIVGEKRQWFKTRIGLDSCSTDRDISFCGHVVADEHTLIIPDARADKRFADNPLVIGQPHIQFYAGAPVRAPDGAILGTFCLLDTQPRSLSAHEQTQLEQFARQAEHLVQLHQSRLRMTQDRAAKKQALARYKAIFHEAALGIVRINAKGIMQGINPFALELLGYEQPEELLGENVKAIMPERWAKEHDRYLQRFQHGGKPRIIGTGRQVFAQHRLGHEIPIHLAVAEVRYPGCNQPDFIGILSDLTELTAAQQREAQERALLRSVMDASDAPILAQHTDGTVMLANRASLAVTGVSEPSNTLDGMRQSFDAANQQAAEQAAARVITHARSEHLRLQSLAGHIYDVTKSPVRDVHGKVTGVVSVAHDVTEMTKANQAIENQQKLLQVLHTGLTDYRTLMSGKKFWAFLKRALRDITDSDYALIGEVLSEQGRPALKIHAITDLSWDENSRKLMHQLADGDMRLTDGTTLLGRTFAHGEVVISPDTPNDPRSKAFPKGHPTLHNYLGIPITDQGNIIGMCAIANSRQVLDDDLVEWLQPFVATCALMIRLYREMDERERIMADLARARDEQARASRAKTDFLSAMSHELRTPLNSIIGFSQLLQSSKRHPLSERTRRQVRQIEKSGHHLLELINEVLELSRIESGKLHLSIEPVTLKEVISAAVETTEGMAEMASITLVTEALQSCDAIVLADYTRLKQVVINLLSNAIKYNREQGRVFIRCWQEEQQIAFSIEDEGIGIPEEKQSELFQPFNRLGAENSAIQGTGVGLSLTKQLVEAMAGTIGFDSTPDQGSTFWVRLPRGSSTDGAHTVTQSLTTDPADQPTADQAPIRCRVLYVEDNPANQRLMEDIFEDIEQAKLYTAGDAPSGLMLAEHLQPELILMDVHLPGMDGFAALNALKANPDSSHIPVAAVSANALPTDIKQGLDAGFSDYLTKPVDINALTELIARYTPGEDT